LLDRNYYFATPVPYVLLIFIIPMYMSRKEDLVRACRTATKICLASIQAISTFFMVYTVYPFAYSSLIVARFLSGPYIIGFVYNAVGIVFSFLIYLLGEVLPTSVMSEKGKLAATRVRFITSFFEWRIHTIVFITHIFYILKKQKYDSMVKTDYLSKIRIKNEYVSSTEKLEILMPKFVLNRIDSFTMSRKFLSLFS
jgi:hypothetical protein